MNFPNTPLWGVPTLSNEPYPKEFRGYPCWTPDSLLLIQHKILALGLMAEDSTSGPNLEPPNRSPATQRDKFEEAWSRFPIDGDHAMSTQTHQPPRTPRTAEDINALTMEERREVLERVVDRMPQTGAAPVDETYRRMMHGQGSEDIPAPPGMVEPSWARLPSTEIVLIPEPGRPEVAASATTPAPISPTQPFQEVPSA